MNATRISSCFDLQYCILTVEWSVPLFVIGRFLGTYMFLGRYASDSPIAQWSERCTYEVTLNARVPSSILGGTIIFALLV